MPLAVRVRSPIGRPERSRTISSASVPLAGQAHASRVSFLGGRVLTLPARSCPS